MPRLLMFDIDGTLTATNDVDTRCYVQTLSEYLGCGIDDDWNHYQHVTDSGIASELLRKHDRPLSDIPLLRERFVALIERELQSSPGCCVEIAGAAKMVARLRELPGVSVGLATGGWSGSAWAKLKCAGIDAVGLPLAAADDAESRTGIMLHCREQAARRTVITETIYIGDGLRDAQAANELGWQFIGVGSGDRAQQLRAAGAAHVWEDFRNQQAVLAAFGGS